MQASTREWSRIGTTPAPAWDHDSVFFEEPIQAGSGDVEDPCSLPLVPLCSPQDPANLGAFRVGKGFAG